MAKQGRNSGKKQSIPPDTTPPDTLLYTLDALDMGDDVQRRFRYQHAYGVILLLATLSGQKPYTALWCEHHEDLLAQRNDAHFDAYQIKTKQDGLINLSDGSLRDSIKRFVEIDQSFPDAIKTFFFVSNARYERSNAQAKIGRNPQKFLQAIKPASTSSDLNPPFTTTFEELRQHCQCESSSLMQVLKKLDLLTGPSLDGFEAVIAQDHLSALPACSDLPAPALAQLRNALIARVYQASCFMTNDPARHWYGLTQDERDNPILQAKQISPESILLSINEHRSQFLASAKNAPMLSTRQQETLDLYLTQSFKEDQVAKLDQAGETDPERATLLHQVFVDLELTPRHDRPGLSRRLAENQLPLFTELETPPEIASSDKKKPLCQGQSSGEPVYNCPTRLKSTTETIRRNVWQKNASTE